MSDNLFSSVERTLGICLAITGLTLTFAVDGSLPEQKQSSLNQNEQQNYTEDLTPEPQQPNLTPNIAQPEIGLHNTQQRWLEIDLSSQRLFAWEGNNQVHAVIISTGKSSTPTRTGEFTIQRKVPQERMQGIGYNLPNVPHVMYYSGGYAIHGAYWHNNFGVPVSHGCINVAPDHASWFYNWASVGTPVIIHD